jgi:serine/threonine-protein kinase
LSYAVNDRLYLRAFDQLEPLLIAGGNVPPLASARTPFFSPDSEWLGFWELGQLKKVSVSGGAPVVLCDFRPPPAGATWTDANEILLGHQNQGIRRVSANGGTAEQIVALDPGQRASRPQLLPDGRLLFTLASTASWDESQIVVQSIDGRDRKIVVSGGADGRYLPSGHLVYALGNSLLAAPFDVDAAATTGGPVPVLDGVLRPGGSVGLGLAMSVADDGTLVYAPAAVGGRPPLTLVWVDRRGREEPLAAPPRAYQHPRVSPDGTRVVIESTDEKQNTDIWLTDSAGRSLTRATTHAARDGEAVWSPDGQQIYFTSVRTGQIGLYRQPANASDRATQVSSLNRQSLALPALTPDGNHILVRDAAGGTSFIAIVNVADGTQKPLVQTPFEEYNAEVSPDGRWLAYQSNNSGTFEVYVQPFPDAGDNLWPVSLGGGAEPVWRRDGRELFYRAPTGALMAVSIAAGSVWQGSAPTQLFAAASYAAAANTVFRGGMARTYDVSPDGQRFLMLKNAEPSSQTTSSARMVVVQNWFEELKAKMPVK